MRRHRRGPALPGWPASRSPAGRTDGRHFRGYNDLDREFYAAREDIVGRGESPDGRIALAANGPQRVTARIAPGTVEALAETEFADAFRAAGVALFLDYTAQVGALKGRIYR